MHNAPTWQPPAVDQSLSPNLPSNNLELRKRSLPSHILDAQRKEALTTMVTEKGALPGEGPTQQAQLSFLKRYFYRPVPKSNQDGEESDAEGYRFSFLSRGFLAVAAVTCLIVIAILCAVLATVYERHHKMEVAMRNSPIREAISSNFPDPSIIRHEGIWYALATNNVAGILSQPDNQSLYQYDKSNVQIATSSDFETWDVLDSEYDPLPNLGDWVRKDNYTSKSTGQQLPYANVWAPAVIQRPSDGKFVLYYSAAVENATRTHCVGAAISNTTSPAGPYIPLNSTLACPVDEGGAIDPAPFIDVDGSMYLAWKVDGNNVGHGGVCGNTVPPLVPTPIMLQKMTDDGVTPDGDAITILDRTKEDGPLVEAPYIVRSAEGIYFLFYSSGCTRAPTYNVRYAWAKNITGPYTRAKNPLLSTGDFRLLAPGSVGVSLRDDGVYEMAFHARITTTLGRVRAMYTSSMKLSGNEVFLVKE